MIKYVIEAQNIYSKGHEQMNKRPYLVIYDSNNYILGFPTTTKNKKSKQYPSHKNPTINTRDGLSEVMIDQLQLIYKKYFTQTNKFLIQNSEYMAVIESFINQIIKDRKNPKMKIVLTFLILFILLIIFLNFYILTNGLLYPQSILIFIQKCVL